MRLRRSILVVCFFYALSFLQAQDYRILHWDVEHGLSQGINQKIIQDTRGFLWITSYEGVNRFDGKTFTNFYSYPVKRNSIKGTETSGLVEDSLHKIWIGSGEGLNRYDPVTDSMTTFVPQRQAGTRVQFIVPIAATLHEVICFEFHGRLIAYNCRTFAQRIITDSVPWYDDYVNVNHSWFDHENHTLWMPAKSGMVQVHLVTGKTTLHFPMLQVNAIVSNDQAHTLILGTDEGLVEYNPASRHSKTTLSLLSVPLGKVISGCYDKAGNLWIGTQEQGVFIIHTDHTITRLVKTSDPFHSINGNQINTIFCDRSGILWLGIATNGIDQLIPGNRFTHYAEGPVSAHRLNNNIVRCFMEDKDGNIWIGTQGGGINIFNPGAQRFSALTRNTLPGLPFDYIRSLAKNEGDHIWIGTEKGMCRTNRKTHHTEHIQFTDLHGRRLHGPFVEQIIDFTGNWLIATKEYGLFRLDKNALVARQCKYPGNRHVVYTAFVNGLLFVSLGDDNPSIFAVRDTGWQKLKKEITSFLITYVIYDRPNKKYWISTLRGLLETDEQLNILHHYNTDHGLGNNYIYAMAPDGADFLWLSTNKGLSVFNKRTRSFRVYTPSDGLQGYEYNARAGFAAADGTLYFGGTNGFDLIRKTAAPLPDEPARLYLKQFLVNNVFRAGEKDVNYTTTIQLPYSGNNISIQIGVIDFITHGNRIRYRLVKADTGWKTADRDVVINYSELPPGRYTFMATAANHNNEWNKDITELTIIIAKPWWQSWWWRLILIGLVTGSVVLIIRSYYQRKLERQRVLFEKQRAVENERTRIATDMHDDLGAGLSRIKFLSETIDIKKQTQQPIEEDIGKIKAYSHEMISKMGEIVWALNEKNDSIHDLAAYIRAYTVEYLSEQGIACTATIPDYLPEIFVSGEFRRNIFLSVKEALHNIVKHAGATEVKLGIVVTHHLSVTVHDNGKGFNPASIRPFSNGISNMSARIKEIGGTVTIRQQAGTLVQITAPLPV
jgi:signal transduction histidine kinase/ligand-binding sensor domain-containing protein